MKQRNVFFPLLFSLALALALLLPALAACGESTDGTTSSAPLSSGHTSTPATAAPPLTTSASTGASTAASTEKPAASTPATTAPDVPHVHDPVWSVAQAPTCTGEGVEESRCLRCGELLASRAIAKIAHAMKNNVCTVCGAHATEGLAITVDEERGIALIVGPGKVKDSEIILPDTYEGLPVTVIDSDAFQNCAFLRSVTIPEGYVTVYTSAFEDCAHLTTVYLSGTVKDIGYGAFAGCSSLKSITIPDSVTTISAYAFENCTLLSSVVIGQNVYSIGVGAFQRCDRLTEAVFRNHSSRWVQIDDQGRNRPIDLSDPAAAARLLREGLELYIN